MKTTATTQELRFLLTYTRLGANDKKRIYQIMMRRKNMDCPSVELKPANENRTHTRHTL